MNSPDTDKAFSGSIPKLYEMYLVPLIFKPYAADLAATLRNESDNKPDDGGTKETSTMKCGGVLLALCGIVATGIVTCASCYDEDGKHLGAQPGRHIKTVRRLDDTIQRFGGNGDNWHMSWANDDKVYVSLCDGTAYRGHLQATLTAACTPLPVIHPS